tara:strand:+ start:2115 stop:2345 length:231 start_codon:yes stop_codon:yes gene_type:complete
MTEIGLYAIMIHICKNKNFNILKSLFYDDIKSKITKKQLILLHIKIEYMDSKSDFYKIMKKWIENNNVRLIKSYLY